MPEKKMSSSKKWLLGCLGLPVALILLIIILNYIPSFFESSETTPPEFITQAEKQVDKRGQALEQLKKKMADDLRLHKKDYDIDQTVMALFSIEKALKDAKNFEELTPFILQQDSDSIAPEILELKYRFFNIYKKMLSAQDEMEDMESVYDLTTGTLLDLMSTVSFPALSVDRKQAQKIWDRRMKETDLKKEVKQRIAECQDQMLEFYFDYFKLGSKYLKEWDQLCALRDRAYLAAYEGDWPEVIKNASEAVAMAPHEREAHLLLAMALLERKNETDTGQAKILIKNFLEKHQGQEAPGHLLAGVINMNEKNFDTAVIDFDQAAVYYPKQQKVLLDRLNLYKKRNFLNKSKEGRVIINMYRGMMTGAGYFSPDFQKARIHLAKNNPDKARKKIFEHFFRRRLQGQWDKVLTDFKYSNRYLQTDKFRISDGNSGKIDLEIDSAYFSNSVIVTVNNQSKTDIHNMTILLCVRLTDMFKGDYISFPVGETKALLKAGESVTVGRQNITDITKEKLGSVKEFKDIIEYAAVLISDEVITWVEAKKVEEIQNPPVDYSQKQGAVEKTQTAVGNAINSAVDYLKPSQKAPEKAKKEATSPEKQGTEETGSKKMVKDLVDAVLEEDKDKAYEKKKKLIKDAVDKSLDYLNDKESKSETP